MQSFLKAWVLKPFFPGFLVIVFFLPPALFGGENRFSKEETVFISNGIGLAAITTWGILNWDYFKNDPKTAHEGWFSENSKTGGQDKLGHFFASYSLSHLLSAMYEKSGYSARQGALIGAVSSFGLTTWMELGDAFSTYGFSREDMVMNVLGATAGYVLYAYPELSEKIDFRLEYLPEFDKADVLTDYENQKFLMALKFDGFEFARKNYLKYLELHLGYYTRGYDNHDTRERNIYLGLGINFSRIFKTASMPRTAKVFNYIQLPYTYVAVEKNLND